MRSEPRGQNAKLRAGFVMEQALGHVTHYRNLRAFTDRQADIAPVWMPIRFDVSGLARLVPLLRSNWSVRASWRARRWLDNIDAQTRLDALLFHSQVTSLFSVEVMRHVPSLISLDATPINYDSVGAFYGHKAAGNGLVDQKKYELNVRAYRAARGFITWSNWARRSLINDYGIQADRIRVVAPGAPPMFFKIGRSRMNAIPAVTGRRTHVLFVGGDFDRKGGPVLLDLMNGPLGERIDLHLVTQSAVRPRRHVTVHRGLEPNSPALRDLFAAADIFVLPTHADCLAVVLEEAAAAGLPVITTNVGALGEAVADGESGILIQPNDPSSLAAALGALVAD